MFKQILSVALVAAVSSAVTLGVDSETDLDQRGRGRGRARASRGTRGAPKGRWGQDSIQAGFEKYDANGDG